MNIIFKQSVIFWFIITMMTACDGTDETPQKNILKPLTTVTFSGEGTLSPREELKNSEEKCVMTVGELVPGVAFIDHGFDIVLSAKKEFTQSEFAKDMLLVAGAFKKKQGCFPIRLNFSAPGAEGLFWRAELLRSDYESYVNEEISSAEILRRSQISGVQTLPSLLEKLRRARQNQDHGLAMQLVTEWRERDPVSDKAKLMEAIILCDKKDFVAARSLLESLLEQHPYDFSILYRSLLILGNLGLPAEAIAQGEKILQDWDKLENISLSRDEVYRVLIYFKLLANDTEDLEKYFSKIVALDDSFLLLKASWQRRLGNGREARLILGQIAPESNFLQQALFNHVLLSLDEKNEAEAKENYKKLKEKFPEMAGEFSSVILFKTKKNKKSELQNGMEKNQP